MTEEKFQEGQEAYSVEFGYNGKINWTVYQVVKVLPKSLKLQEADCRPRLVRQQQSGIFCRYSGAIIKPSRESALRAAIAKIRVKYNQCVDAVQMYVERLSLLQDEIDKEKGGSHDKA